MSDLPVFRKVSEETIFDGVVVSMRRALFESPDGEIMDREIVRHPGAVMVVPVVGDEAVLVRQFRAPIEQWVLEIPAGKRDVEGEDPEVGARRELAEEVGLEGGELQLLSAFYNTPGFCDEYSWLYLATGCTETEIDRHGAEEQYMTIERIRLDDVPQLIASGIINDAKTIMGLLLARERLRGDATG